MGTNVAANLQNLHETGEEGTPLSWSNNLGEFHYVMTAFMPLLVGMKYPTGMEYLMILITLLLVSLVFYFVLMYFAKKLQAYRDYKDFGAFINKISNLFGIFSLVIELLIILLAYGSVRLFLWCIGIGGVAVGVLLLLRLAFVELREKLISIIGHLMQYWTTFYDSSAVAVLVPLRQAIVELREKLILVIAPLIQYCARFCDSSAVAVLAPLRLAFVELREKLILIIAPLIQYCARFCDGSAVADQEMINLDHEAQDQNQIKELPPVEYLATAYT